MKLTWWRVLIIVVAMMTTYVFVNLLGYKRGQIDYARDHITYTIIAGHVVHIMGKAPWPDTELKEIPE